MCKVFEKGENVIAVTLLFEGMGGGALVVCVRFWAAGGLIGIVVGSARA
jgi:hypothetical protein